VHIFRQVSVLEDTVIAGFLSLHKPVNLTTAPSRSYGAEQRRMSKIVIFS
jgi:hypothetical protein